MLFNLDAYQFYYTLQITIFWLNFFLLCSRRTGHCPERVCLPPPQYNAASGRIGSKSFSRTSSFQKSSPAYPHPGAGLGTSSSSTPAYSSTAPPSASAYSSTAPPSTSTYENQVTFFLLSSARHTLHHQSHKTRLMLCFLYVEQLCPICITSPKNMAFGCGHQVIYESMHYLFTCHVLFKVLGDETDFHVHTLILWIRHAVIVESFWMLAQFADVQLRPE